ncbi:MAG: hypothetical protein EZS28_033237 [Streblomastix strix]|uniref:Uncharacterized protein n=1 Tax=Streblomastix strix TaxID=222440 RepID=A0A5J4UKQ8_9EUKA|nr:MAG: hypothetical protein EZS28_033237 [Streblomastix strix]
MVYFQDTQQFANKLIKQIYNYNRKQSLDFTHINFQGLEIELYVQEQPFFDWLKRIDNKHGRSFRDNKYGALWWNEDITIPAQRGQISFRLKKLLDLMVMGLDETILNTYTGHARNSKSTNEYYERPSCKIDKQVGELLTTVSNKRGGMRCQQSFMVGYAHAVR